MRPPQRANLALAILAALAALSACSEEPVPFAEVQDIIDEQCMSLSETGCHRPDGISVEFIDLSEYARGDIVNVPSGQVPMLDFIEPGDPDRSYLWHKINGTHLGEDVMGQGHPMPLGKSPLSDEYLATIEAWIESGAGR